MKFISIGRIAGTYGLDGELKIKPNTSHPELFDQMEFLLLTYENELKRSLKIEDIREHNNLLIVRLKGIDSEMYQLQKICCQKQMMMKFTGLK